MSDLEARIRKFEKGIQEKADAIPKDETLERIKALIGEPGVPITVPKIKLSEELKKNIFLNVVDIVKSGSDPKDIGNLVVNFIQQTIDHINSNSDLEEVSDNTTGKGGFKGSFRRAE